MLEREIAACAAPPVLVATVRSRSLRADAG